MTTYGTSHFTGFKAAVKYYAVYGETERSVQRKIDEGLISIGKPPLKPGQKLVVIPDEGRYAIQEEK